MTREEAKKILFIVSNTYPNFKPNDMSITIDIWTKILGEYSYHDIETALMAYMSTDTSGFAPTPGQVISKMHLVDELSDLGEMEAWALVGRALRDSTYHAQERFDELPKDVKRAVGSADNLRAWGMDENYNENVAQSQFIASYKNVLRRKREIAMLPAAQRALLENTTRLMIGG